MTAAVLLPWGAALLTLALTATGAAQASCVTPNASGSDAKHGAYHFSPAVYHPGDADAQFVMAGDFGDNAPIVGLWQFRATGIAPDFGTQAWHADGTELMYSMGPNPATGNVCQGVWRRVGSRTYVVNHVAMGWAAPGADPALGAQFVRVHLHYTITLDPSGNRFTGHYTADIYLESASNPFYEDPVGNAPIASGGGDVTASRVRPDPAP